MEDHDQLELIAIENGIYYPSMADFGGRGIVFDVGGIDYHVAVDWQSVRYDVVPETVANRAPQERARYHLYDERGNEFDFIDLTHDYDDSIDWLNELLDEREQPMPEPEPETEKSEEDFEFPEAYDDPEEYEDAYEPAPMPRRQRRPVIHSFKKPRARHLHRGIDYKELRREREAWEDEILTARLREERRRWEASYKRRSSRA